MIFKVFSDAGIAFLHLLELLVHDLRYRREVGAQNFDLLVFHPL